jgi:lipopolysaccharide export LptBFGC system permease protein LptF
MIEQERLDQSYSAFVRELHLRISNVATSTRFKQGNRPLIYWPSVVVFVAVALGLAGLIARALQIGASGGAAFVGAFLALYLWQVGNFLRRNRPGEYRPGALPKEVMPPQ